MARQLFGTDGIRGIAGDFPLDPSTVQAIGMALGEWASRHGPRPEVVIGMDTRESGPWLAAQVAGGLDCHRVRPRFAGLVTTPGIAYLTRTGPFVAGVMISASHNPYRDNGIKVFDHSGYKLPDEVEHRLEERIFALLESRQQARTVSLEIDEGLDRAYIDYLASTFPGSLDGLPVVLDCANGAASRLAPALFERLGARVETIGCSPDGCNINLNCGALHLEGLRRRVLETGARLGVAFDGDADRAMFISASGKIVDGDAVMLIAARWLLGHGRLKSNGGKPEVVATIMSNLGLELALARHGIGLVRTPVGDKYVLEEMMRRGVNLGGEQSGHVVFHDYATTGDGLLTALRVLEIGSDLDALTSGFEVFPQLLVNVRVKRKRPLAELARVNREIAAAREAFGEQGRVIVRFSGTEPLARVMVEANDPALVERFAHRIADAIRAELS